MKLDREQRRSNPPTTPSPAPAVRDRGEVARTVGTKGTAVYHLVGEPICKRGYNVVAFEKTEVTPTVIGQRYGMKLPSMLLGIGAVLDLAGTSVRYAADLYPLDEDPWIQDYEALAGDWQCVSGDLREAGRRFRK